MKITTPELLFLPRMEKYIGIIFNLLKNYSPASLLKDFDFRVKAVVANFAEDLFV